MAMDGNGEFSIVNVNRAASYSAEKVLDDLLASIGIIGEHHLISCVRLPMKRFGHVLTFLIRSPMEAKILNVCIGSEKIWHTRFNGIFMASANAFIWTPITVEEAVQGVLATSIKQFDDSYQLPENIKDLNGEKLKRDIMRSSSYHDIILDLKKILWKSEINKLSSFITRME